MGGIVPSKRYQELINSKEIVIDPFYKEFRKPETYPIHIAGNEFYVYMQSRGMPINPFMDHTEFIRKNGKKMDFRKIDNRYVLRPGVMALLESFEEFGFSNGFTADIMPETSNTRIGIFAAPGVIHGGHGIKKPFKPTIVVYNPTGVMNVELIATYIENNEFVYGPPIAQIRIHKLDEPVDIGYDDMDGSYSGHDKVQPSQVGKAFKQRRIKIPENSKHYDSKPRNTSLDNF